MSILTKLVLKYNIEKYIYSKLMQVYNVFT